MRWGGSLTSCRDRCGVGRVSSLPRCEWRKDMGVMSIGGSRLLLCVFSCGLVMWRQGFISPVLKCGTNYLSVVCSVVPKNWNCCRENLSRPLKSAAGRRLVIV